MFNAKTIQKSQHDESESKALSDNERANILAERLKNGEKSIRRALLFV